jgi:hypothetical protein
MNLAEFVEQSLTEILAGIRAAQQKEGGGAVGAQMYGEGKGWIVRAAAFPGTSRLWTSTCLWWLRTRPAAKAI